MNKKLIIYDVNCNYSLTINDSLLADKLLDSLREFSAESAVMLPDQVKIVIGLSLFELSQHLTAT